MNENTNENINENINDNKLINDDILLYLEYLYVENTTTTMHMQKQEIEYKIKLDFHAVIYAVFFFNIK